MSFSRVVLAALLASPAAAQMRILPSEIRSAPSVSLPATPSALSVAPLGAAMTAAPSLSALPAAAATVAPAPAAAPLAAAAVPLAAAPVAAAALGRPTHESNGSGTSSPYGSVAALAASDKAAPENAGLAFDGGRKLNVLMAAAESVPFIKTGGLADVVNDVSRGLAARGHEVMLVLPKHLQLKTDGFELKRAGRISVPMGGGRKVATLWTTEHEGVKVVLIDHRGMFQSTKGPYDAGSVYGEDANEARYAFFARAALEAARALHFRPDVVHSHDWHASLIAPYLKLDGFNLDPLHMAKGDGMPVSVLTIHNIAFQGQYGPEVAGKIGFGAANPGLAATLEHNGGVNYLKAGLVNADAITTVSRTYAKEIQEDPAFGMGLENILSARSKDVTGIVNGVDPELWGPTTDPLIAQRFGIDDVEAGKAANKADLQRRMGLQVDPNAPIFAVASRLSHQKGIDIVLDAVHSIVGRGGQLVISGAGDKELEQRVAEIVKFYSYYGRVAFHTFDESFVHAVYASADFLLMPSRFEPCGLSQLIAQRYGTLPIVARTGGLADTIRDLRDHPESGDGLFVLPAQDGGIWETINDAYAGYRNPEALAAARRSAMAKDSSWGPALDEYEALFRRLAASAK